MRLSGQLHRLCRLSPVTASIVLATILLTTTLLAPVKVYGQDTPTLKIYTEVRNGAQIVVDDQGEPWVDNPASRLLEAVLLESGLNYEVSMVPWTRLLLNLETESNSIGYPVLRTDERQPQYYWLGIIRPVTSHLYGLTSAIDSLPTNLKAARHYRIGSIRGDVFSGYLESRGFDNLIQFGNNTPWLTMMERNRIDLMPYAEHGIAEYLGRLDKPIETLTPVINLDNLSTGLYFVLNRNSSDAIRERLTKAYQAVVASGLYEQIMGIEYSGPEL